MRNGKKSCILFLVLALLLSGLQIPAGKEAFAAKKMKLSKKKLTLQIGEKKKLTVKNKKGKLKWKTGKKKVATVSKKGVVKAKKKGKTTITAQITYKKKKTKLKCKVTVVKKKKSTKKPTAKPTKKPTQRPTNKPTPKNSPIVPPTDLSKAVEWNKEKQGDFFVTGIRFEDSSLTYWIKDNVIFLKMGSRVSVKSAVPDLKKCSFNVKAGKKNYQNVTVNDIRWNEKPYYNSASDNGYYDFKLYIKVDGKMYCSAAKMVEKRGTAVSDTGVNFRIESIQYEQKEITAVKDAMKPYHYMVETPENTSVQTLLPDLAKVRFKASYLDMPVQITKISDVVWKETSYYGEEQASGGYYSFVLTGRNGAQEIEVPIILSDFNEKLTIQEYSYKLNGEDRRGTMPDYADTISIAVPKGKTIKEVWPDMASDFVFSCNYKDQTYQGIKPSSVVWVDTPYYESGCDGGYYRFLLSVTMADGSTVSREFKLIEEYREITYEVTGVLKAATGEFAARESLNFYNSADGGSSYDTETGENGEYRIDLPEGSYSVFWNEMYIDSVTVENKNVVCNLQSEDMFRVSGVIYRQGKIWADAGIHFELEDVSVFCRSDKKTGAYSVYLPKNQYIEELNVNGATVKRDGMPNSIKENIIFDIKTDLVKISGTIYSKKGKPFANKSEVTLETESYSIYHFNTDLDGSYEIYVPAYETYYYVFGNKDVDAVEVKKEDVTGKDITLGLTHVTGTLTSTNGSVIREADCIFNDASGEYYSYVLTDGDGNYSLYAEPGTYSVRVYTTAFHVELDNKIQVGSEDSVCDLATPLYKVSGRIRNNGKLLREADVHLTVGADDSVGTFTTDENGGYTLFLSEGTYSLNIEYGEKQAQTLTVTDDKSQDFDFSYSIIKGHIYRAEGVEFEDMMENISIINPSGEEVKRIFYLFSSEYEWYFDEELEKGLYKVNFNGITLDTFTVSGKETTHDIVLNLFLVSGHVTGVPESEIPPLEFRGGDIDGTLRATLYDLEGGRVSYHVYLPKGIYTAHMGDKELGTVEVTGDKSGVEFAYSE